MTKTDKQQAIDAAVAQVEKQFGKGSIMRLGDDAVNAKIEAIPTGSIGLDGALSIGGLPRGRIIDVVGIESGGKTTLMLHVIAEAQKNGGVAAFIDAEHAFMLSHAKNIGVDVESLYYVAPDSGEMAGEIAETLVRSNAFDIIVIDSTAALTPQAEIDGSVGDSHVALQARLIAQILRKLTGVVSKSKTCLVFISQIRQKIGVFFGSNEESTGGRALKFYASVRLDVRRVTSLKEGDEIIGNRVKVKVIKSKVGIPFKQAEFDLYFNSGICRETEVLDLAEKAGIIKKAGTWYSYNEERLGQGREQSKQYLEDNPEVMEELTQKVYKSFLNKNEISDIALAVETLYDLRDENNILKKDAKTQEIDWEGVKYTYRKLVRYIEKQGLFNKVRERVELKMNDKEDQENLINS